VSESVGDPVGLDQVGVKIEACALFMMLAALRRVLLRLVSCFRSRRAETDLAREVAAHLQLSEDQSIAQGW
jgi:hypothetical protein